MTGDRARGALLYGCAAALLLAGSGWWFAAAPRDEQDQRFREWRQTARELLPDMADQNDGGTVSLAAGADHEVTIDAGPGEFVVAIVCAGGDDSQVRVSVGQPGQDSGRGLACSGGRQPDTFSVGLGGPMRMNVSVNEKGPVVFRYSVWRSG